MLQTLEKYKANKEAIQTFEQYTNTQVYLPNLFYVYMYMCELTWKSNNTTR